MAEFNVQSPTEHDLKQRVEYLQQRVQQLEEQVHCLNSIISHIPGNIYWKDKSGKHLGCNQGIVELSHFSSSADIVGKTLFNILDTAHALEIDKVDQRIMATAVPETLEEHGFDKHGNPAVYLSKKTPLFNEQNEVIGLLGMTFDITERKQAEMALAQAKMEAELANQTKTEFLQNMSHDMRTPLNGMLGYLQILILRERDKQKRQVLDEILASGRGLLKLLNEIIEVMSLQSGKLPIKLSEFNIKTLMDELMHLMWPSIKQKGLKFTLSYQEDFPAVITTDSSRLFRILLNLISNAIKFTLQGEIRVELSCHDQGRSLQVMVKDTGIGIPADKHTQIFENFSRLSASYQGIYKGYGIGLHIVKQFITDLGGQIAVNSELNQGSAFTFSLPI